MSIGTVLKSVLTLLSKWLEILYGKVDLDINVIIKEIEDFDEMVNRPYLEGRRPTIHYNFVRPFESLIIKLSEELSEYEEIGSSELQLHSPEPEKDRTPTGSKKMDGATKRSDFMKSHVELTFLHDSEWASIEGRLCLATEFVPMSGSIVNGAVVAHDQTTPYAGVKLKVAGHDDDITGYVTNKLDFAMLWAAFNDNALALDGVHREPSLPGCSNLSELPHEIWLLWSRKRYSGPAKLVPKAVLPKLIVMVAHEGTFDQFSAELECAAHEPLVAWIPEVRLRSEERALAHGLQDRIKLLPKVWDDIIKPT